MRVTVTDLKNKLSHYLRLVKQGETIEVVEHSVPIARLERSEGAASREDDRLRRLVRDGVVSQAKPAARDLLSEPVLPCRGDAARVLVEERGDR